MLTRAELARHTLLNSYKKDNDLLRATKHKVLYDTKRLPQSLGLEDDLFGAIQPVIGKLVSTLSFEEGNPTEKAALYSAIKKAVEGTDDHQIKKPEVYNFILDLVALQGDYYVSEDELKPIEGIKIRLGREGSVSDLKLIFEG